MIRNNYYLADILRVCEIKDLIWVMRFQSPLVYNVIYSLGNCNYITICCFVLHAIKMENQKKKFFMVKLEIFCLELGKKHTFWHWEWGRISAPKSGDQLTRALLRNCFLVVSFYIQVRFSYTAAEIQYGVVRIGNSH